jgi:predicted Fe-Mo cluster-binding NifX family protein
MMKIAISAKGNTPASKVAPFSGQDAGFIIYNSDNFGFTYLDDSTRNGRLKANRHPSAQMFVDAGIDVIVVAGIALEAAHVLGRSGIKIYECVSATAWEAIQALKLNLLQAVDNDSAGLDYREMSIK